MHIWKWLGWENEKNEARMQELLDFPSLPRCTVHMSRLPVQMQRHSNPLKCVGFLFYSRLIYPAYYYTNTKIFNRQFCFKNYKLFLEAAKIKNSAQRYPWNIYLINKLQRYPWNIYLIKNIDIWFLDQLKVF